jgi:hypothetical protein
MFKLLSVKQYLWVLLLLAPFYTNASHVAGGDIEYENIGPRQWKVRLTIYRDCTGVTLCGSSSCPQTMTARPNVSLNPAGCVSNPNQVIFFLSLVSVQDAESFRKEACPTFKNACTNLGQVTAGTYTPAIEKYVFEGTLNLNITSLDTTSCKYWDISWDLCCRNVGITNLLNSGSQDIRLSATINIFNRSQGGVLNNNSPKLTNEAVMLIPSGVPQSIALGAIDPDGDSLTYALDSARRSDGTPVTYQPPFSSTNPFPLNSARPPHIYYPQPTGPYVIIDSTTGDIRFNAVNNTPYNLSGVLNLVIKQWNYDSLNNPLLVGITQRELQYYTFVAPGNNPPQIRTIPANTGNTPIVNYTVCAGQQLCFIVTAHDTDFYPNIPRTDTTTLSWNNGIVRPGKLTFGRIDTVNRPRQDQWQFCWQTEDADARSLPYQFTVTAADNRCPWIGRTTQTFSIKVLPRAAFDQQQELLQCSRLVYKVRKTNTKQFFSSATVQIANQPNDFTFASGSRIINAIQPNPAALTGVPLDTPRVIISDTFSYPLPGKYFVRITVNTPGALPGQFCSKIITDTISIDSLISVSILDTLVCRNSTINIVAQTTGADTLTFTWYKNGLNTNPVFGPSTSAKTYQTTDSVTTKYYVKVQGGYNCTVVDSMMLRIDPRPSFRIVNPVQCLSTNNNFTAVDTSKITKPYNRLWLLPNNTTSTDSAVTFNYNTTGTHHVKLVTTSSQGCVDTTIQTISINARPTAIINYTDTTICAGDTTQLSALPNANHTYQWLKNGSVINGQTALIYSATTSGLYKFVLTSAFGCKDTSRAVNVIVSNVPVISSVTPSNICASTQTLNLPNRAITPSNVQGGTGVWSMSSTPNAVIGNTLNVSELDGLPQDTFYTNMGTNVAAANRGYYINYQYTAPTSAGGCTAKDSILVRVFALPKTTAGSDNAYCYERGLINLVNHNQQPKDATGKTGVWSLVSGGGLVVNNVSPSLTTYSFNTKAAVVNSDINRLRYVYTQTYNQAPIVSNLSCSQSDTVIIRVIKGWADAGANQELCATDGLINVRQKQGITTNGIFTDSLFNPITNFNTYTAAKFPFVNKLWFVEDSSGCVVKDSVYYTVRPIPTINAGSDETFCGTGVITLATKQNVNPVGGSFYDINQQQVTNFNIATAAVMPQQNVFTYQVPVNTGNIVCVGIDTFVYVVIPTAQLTSITGNLTPVKNTVQTYTTNVNPYHSYVWQITGGQLQSTAQNSATVLWGNVGNGNIKVIAQHPSCTDVELNQQVQITPSTGLTEQAVIPNLLIYPNPANSSVTVSFESDKTAQIELLNTMMQSVSTYNVTPSQGNIEKDIETNTLGSGMYFIRINVNGQSGMYKLIIAR